MNHTQLKLMLDKYVDTIPAYGAYTLRSQLQKDLKQFAEAALEGMLKSIAAYGTNTHSYAEAQAFLIEFRRTV